MSEPRFDLLDDYARELDREADLIVPPNSAAYVRRIGQSRRTRRIIVAVVIAAVALLTTGAALAVLSVMKSDVPPWAATPGPSQASPAPTQSPTASASTTSSPTPASTRSASSATPRATSPSATAAASVVTLATPLELKSAANINAVTWMTSGAKSFLITELARVRAASGCATDYLIVNAYKGTELISGSNFGCDSAQATWGNLAGTWKLVFAGQAVPTCAEVRSSGWTSTIPKDFPGGQCYDPSGNVVTYTP